MKFNKNFITYDENAIVQKEVAIKLADNIFEFYKKKEYDSILELGCGTGIFTREYLKKIKSNSLTLNDFFNTKDYLNDINYTDFLQGDMRESINNNYDIIISSSSFQWIDNLDFFIKNLSFKTNNLAFSIYLDGNLKEIKEYFNIGLSYEDKYSILNILNKYFSKISFSSEEKVLNFPSSLDALRHLKKTGVTVGGNSSIKNIRNYKNTRLTYIIGYFICSK